MTATVSKEPKEEVGLREAANRLGVLLGHTYELVWCGRLKGRKVGKRWLINVNSINERLKSLSK